MMVFPDMALDKVVHHGRKRPDRCSAHREEILVELVANASPQYGGFINACAPKIGCRSCLADSKGNSEMRISETALATSEPLFVQFVECMRAIRGYHCQVFVERPESNLYSETLRVLNHYQQDRTQAAYCLIVNGLVWDAEVIIRVAYETFAKVAFLATASVEQRDELLHEYWELLGAVYDRQSALKAEACEHLLNRFGSQGDTRVMAALRDRRVYRTDPLGDKRFRKQLEQRWSFSEILGALKGGRLGNASLVGIDALAHIYGMSSHFAHANSRALDLLEDRATRGGDLLQLEVGHICRMLTDMVSITSFSLFLCERSWAGGNKMPDPLAAAFRSMLESAKPFQVAFEASQDELYSSWPMNE